METGQEHVADRRATAQPSSPKTNDPTATALDGVEAIFDQAPEAMVVAAGRQWRLVAANRMAQELFLFGSNAQVLSDLTLADLFVDGAASVQKLLDALDGTEHAVKHEAEMRDRFSLTFPAAVSARRVEADGKPVVVVSVRDVSELKRAEARTRFFYAMANTSVDAIVAWSGGDALVYANPAAHELFGVGPDQLLGRPIRDLFEDGATTEAILREAEARGTWQGSLRMCRADGSPFDASLTAWSQADSGGLPVTVCFLRDVTEHRRAQEALHASKERFRTLIEAVPDIIAEIDAAGHYVWLNKPGHQFFGPDALGRNMAEFAADEGARAEAIETIQRLLDGAVDTIELESRQRRHDGAERLLAWTGKPLRDVANSVTRALLTARDITETQQMHAKLERYSQDLESLVAERTHEVHLLSRITTSTVTAWVISDPAGRLVRWNRAFEKLVGHRMEELVTMRWTDLIPVDQHRLEQRLVELAMAGEGHQVIEQDLCRGNGERIAVECRFDALDVGEPEPVVFRIVTDISSRRETERRLIEARRDAEDSSRLKSEFLASISHELRTPLNGIVGLANTLVRLRIQDKDEQTDDFLARIVKSSRHLQDLITQVLDISRIEAGQLTLSLKAVCPTEVLQAVESHFLAAFEERSLTFTSTVADETPAVLADRTRLVQILVNLLSNAVKFTDPGGSITASAAPTQHGTFVEFCVSDTGRGIPADKLEQVFERFEQLDRSGSRLGVGLGLAICRQLVVAQGGHICAESKLGAGSRFRFTLPAQTEPLSKELIIEPPRETP